MQNLFVLFATPAAVLQLSGGSSYLDFVNSNARISATCGGEGASVRHFHPTSYMGDYDESATIKAVLTNVAHSCAGRSLYTPCVPPDSSYPKLFYCAWSPVGSDAANGLQLGPFAAERTADSVNGVVLGWEVSVTCPMLPKELFTSSIDGNRMARAVLAVLHNVSSDASAQALKFEGHTNVIQWEM